MYDLVIIGGGPSGIFAGLIAKKFNDKTGIVVLEKGKSILGKIKISGGGRCNVTHAAFDSKTLSKNYPRGGKELISPFCRFQPKDMIEWLEKQGVRLKIDEEGRVFPFSDDSQTVIDCFLREIKKSDLEVKCNQNIVDITKKNNLFEITLNDGKEKICSKKLLLAAGSSPEIVKYAENLGHSFEPFVPSLFSFRIEDSDILKHAGISCDKVKVSLQETRWLFEGPILITHEGFSGPAIINLSSLGAKFLFEKNYKTILEINWLPAFSKEHIFQQFLKLKDQNLKKSFIKLNPFKFPLSLWSYFLNSSGIGPDSTVNHISNNKFAKLSEKLAFDEYNIISKSRGKGEFVSCGGINLKEVNFKDMQSRICENLFFAGEILNIDGITGGFNLQNCWTTGFIVGSSI